MQRAERAVTLRLRGFAGKRETAQVVPDIRHRAAWKAGRTRCRKSSGNGLRCAGRVPMRRAMVPKVLESITFIARATTTHGHAAGRFGAVDRLVAVDRLGQNGHERSMRLDDH